MTEPYDRTVDLSGSGSASQGHDGFRERAAGEPYLGGVTWVPPAECLHEGPWVGNESGIEDRSGTWEDRAPGLAPRTNCAKGGVASPGAGKGARSSEAPHCHQGDQKQAMCQSEGKTP
jgi:hypothetical protein